MQKEGNFKILKEIERERERERGERERERRERRERGREGYIPLCEVKRAN